MSARTLTALFATIALSTIAIPAGADGERSYIKVKNDSSWTIDCRAFWGNQTVAFNGVAASTTTEAKQIAISPTERTLVCKKSGAAPTPETVGGPVKFKVDSVANLTINCAHKDGQNGLSCSVSKDAPTPSAGSGSASASASAPVPRPDSPGGRPPSNERPR